MRLLASATVVGQVVQRRETFALKECAEMHVTAHSKIAIVLFVDGFHVGVVPLIEIGEQATRLPIGVCMNSQVE